MNDVCWYMAQNGESFWSERFDFDRHREHGPYIQISCKAAHVLDRRSFKTFLIICNYEQNEDVF